MGLVKAPFDDDDEPVKSYPDDIHIRHTSDDPPQYLVDVPLGFTIPTRSNSIVLRYPVFDSIEDASLFADVWTVTGGFALMDDSAHGVPPRVASASNRALAVYLLTQGYTTEDVTNVLGVKRATVHSFKSRLQADAEEIREELRKEADDSPNETQPDPMWWCPDCEKWNGAELSQCLGCDRDRPDNPRLRGDS